MDRALKLEQDFLECFSGKTIPKNSVLPTTLIGFPHKSIAGCDEIYGRLSLPLLSCSCGGRGQLRGGLPQSKKSDRGAIGALHLDPHSGEAVMLHPQDPTTFTSTAPHRHSLTKLASPACLSSSNARPGAVTETATEGHRPRPKRDSDTDANRVRGN